MVKFSVALLLVSASIFSSVHVSATSRHRTLVRRFGSRPDCPEKISAVKKDLTSYISSQVASLDSLLSNSGGGTREKSSTFVDEHGVPELVNVKEIVSNSPTGSNSKHWSWSWSSHSFWNNAGTKSDASNAEPSDDIRASNAPAQVSRPELAKAFAQNRPQGAPVRAKSSSSHESSSQYIHNYGHQGNKTYESTHFSFSNSFSSSLIVNDYVITSHVSKAANSAPFSAAQVEWLKNHKLPKMLSVPYGAHIPRPADAGICNQRFPFSGQTYQNSQANPRFESAYPEHQLDPMAKKALDLHNIERARYGLELLQWNTELANMAACWADLKAYGHSQDHFCATGENIAYGYGDPCYTTPLIGMENAINSFLDEDRTYAAKRQFGEDTGHWTQIVWKDTKYVGCATSQRKNFLDEQDTSIYVVCEYFPAGNVMGQFEVKVPEPKPTSQYRSQCSANEMHWS